MVSMFPLHVQQPACWPPDASVSSAFPSGTLGTSLLSSPPQLQPLLHHPHQFSQPRVNTPPNRSAEVCASPSAFPNFHITASEPKRVGPLTVTAKQCDYCATKSTPMWRHGPPGSEFHTLCNSCGVKWRRGKILFDNAKVAKGSLKRGSDDSGSDIYDDENDDELALAVAHAAKNHSGRRACKVEVEDPVQMLIKSLQTNADKIPCLVETLCFHDPQFKTTLESGQEIELDLMSLDTSLWVKLVEGREGVLLVSAKFSLR
ncbi:hypothetical protein HK096_005277, partial [Nowakowskiella sp. JEL0078]